MHLGWEKSLFCKVDFWSNVDLGQRLTLINVDFFWKWGERKIWLGQKMGYDRCPYLCSSRRFENESFKLTGRRDLNIRVHHFLPVLTIKCYECDAMNAML